MARVEDFQNRESHCIEGSNALMLSQSVQDLFEAKSGISGRNALPELLDFGTGSELYLSAAYTDERLSARIFMADETEQKLDAPKIQVPSDALARPSVIRTKEDEAIWDEMQKPHKLGKHESATHIGLTPEVIAEMQAKGQASKLEFFDSAAEGALATLQKPPVEQVLIASNITPNIPNLEQKQQYPDIQSDSDKPKIVQNFDYNGGLPTLVPSPEQLGITPELIKNVGHAVGDGIYQQKHFYRGHIGETMASIPETSWTEAYKAYPEFAKAGLSEKQVTELMQAITRNELFFYDFGDKQDDDSMRNTGKPFQYPFHERNPGSATLGVSQVSLDGVKKFEKEFQLQMGKFKGHEADALLDPKNAPMIIAAVLAHNIRDYTGHYPINERTLAYSFNPDVPGENGKKPPVDETLKESEHCANVMRQLAIIRGQAVPKPDEK